MASVFMEYGAIDDSIVEKLRDDDNVRVRLQVDIHGISISSF
jgi:hypothetical protein